MQSNAGRHQSTGARRFPRMPQAWMAHNQPQLAGSLSDPDPMAPGSPRSSWPHHLLRCSRSVGRLLRSSGGRAVNCRRPRLERCSAGHPCSRHGPSPSAPRCHWSIGPIRRGAWHRDGVGKRQREALHSGRDRAHRRRGHRLSRFSPVGPAHDVSHCPSDHWRRLIQGQDIRRHVKIS